jgi:FtsP/CotA-like multicopper oxidase with cupredoxin domain
MNDTTAQRLRHALVVSAATLSLACAAGRAPGAHRHTALPERFASGAASYDDHRTVEKDDCPELRAPAGSTLVVHVYATGVQTYRWSGTSWSFVAPDAVLSADSSGRSKVGFHYAGPTWESGSGSRVVGTVSRRCTPDSTAIPWLSLDAKSNEAPGIFHGITFIQRMKTVGGIAPATRGSVAGEEVRVPYRAEYFFFRTS